MIMILKYKLYVYLQIWNHPDVLYNFLKKRSEVNAAIEEDLDLEEIGGVTKAGRAKNNKTTRRTGKPRVSIQSYFITCRTHVFFLASWFIPHIAG